MARIRTIKPEFFKHEELYLAEIEEKLPLRLAFAGLFGVSDREGRFKWRPNQIKLDILPYDKVDFSLVLDALATRGFIQEYEDENGERFGYIPTFLDHQVINNREMDSSIISPFDASVTRDPRALILHKGKGREGKGKERKGREVSARTRAAAPKHSFPPVHSRTSPPPPSKPLPPASAVTPTSHSPTSSPPARPAPPSTANGRKTSASLSAPRRSGSSAKTIGGSPKTPGVAAAPPVSPRMEPSPRSTSADPRRSPATSFSRPPPQPPPQNESDHYRKLRPEPQNSPQNGNAKHRKQHPHPDPRLRRLRAT